MRLALVQMRMDADRASNVARALDRMSDAAAAGADVVLLRDRRPGIYDDFLTAR